MVRFNNDLVRRKDKVKARKADLYSNKSVLQRNSVFVTNSIFFGPYICAI